jgi:hypothetical protein
MPFTLAQMIRIPGSAESSFDHGAFEPRTRRVFVARTYGFPLRFFSGPGRVR